MPATDADVAEDIRHFQERLHAFELAHHDSIYNQIKAHVRDLRELERISRHLAQLEDILGDLRLETLQEADVTQLLVKWEDDAGQVATLPERILKPT